MDRKGRSRLEGRGLDRVRAGPGARLSPRLPSRARRLLWFVRCVVVAIRATFPNPVEHASWLVTLEELDS
jgi:hypothetical protein